MSSSDDKLHVCCYFGPDRCRHARRRSQPASWRRFPPPRAHRAGSSPSPTLQPCAKIPVTAPPVPPWGASPIPWGARLSSGLHGAASVLCTGDVFAPVFVCPPPPSSQPCSCCQQSEPKGGGAQRMEPAPGAPRLAARPRQPPRSQNPAPAPRGRFWGCQTSPYPPHQPLRSIPPVT